LTSVGVSSGLDLTLARDVAQDPVMFLRRPGGQSQFSRYLPNQAKRPGPIRDLQSWILENLARDQSVEKLADRVAMSPRSFTRVFTREADTPPAKFVKGARLDAARQRPEQGTEGLEQVATKHLTSSSSFIPPDRCGAVCTDKRCISPRSIHSHHRRSWRDVNPATSVAIASGSSRVAKCPASRICISAFGASLK